MEDTTKYCHIEFQFPCILRKKEIQYYYYYLDNHCEKLNSLSEQQQQQKIMIIALELTFQRFCPIITNPQSFT